MPEVAGVRNDGRARKRTGGLSGRCAHEHLLRLPQAMLAPRSTSRWPVRQVSIRKATATASSSGNQPPSNSLIEFAAKKSEIDDQEEAVHGRDASGL